MVSLGFRSFFFIILSECLTVSIQNKLRSFSFVIRHLLNIGNRPVFKAVDSFSHSGILVDSSVVCMYVGFSSKLKKIFVKEMEKERKG